MSTADTGKCTDRVRPHYQNRITDLRERFHAETHPKETCRTCKGTGKIGAKEYSCEYCEDGTYPEDGRLNEYGLSFGYVAPGTFKGQRRGYWRYQLSWGGPSDEFRFYCDKRRQPVRIEYWFMDWFDGAKVTVKPESTDWRLLMDIWTWFDDADVVNATYRQATEN